ncbi:MAG TPA: tRNA uridine-5-carboxymethylaminomethyl(34) synthesis GTPase MnmE, partial [Clostridiales bacterium]|nr:tRNA uridine-5-carboxymethylaminomethyl(34) synthesis GTPase MnmE [Clostridiales bacterium]
LDYPDEDIEPFRLQAYADTLKSASWQLDALLSSCRRGNFIKNGVQTAILGAPNAGKSSLL